jgi:hypothetical protein
MRQKYIFIAQWIKSEIPRKRVVISWFGLKWNIGLYTVMDTCLTSVAYQSNSDKYVTFIPEDLYTAHNSAAVSFNLRVPFHWNPIGAPHRTGVSAKLINIICTAPSLQQRSRSTYRRNCRRRLHPWRWVLGINLRLLINHVCSSECKGDVQLLSDGWLQSEFNIGTSWMEIIKFWDTNVA